MVTFKEVESQCWDNMENGNMFFLYLFQHKFSFYTAEKAFDVA